MSDGLVGAPPSGPAQYGPVHVPLNDGDVRDDDGTVFTRLLNDQEDAPPVVPSTPAAPVTEPPKERAETTRTMTGNVILANDATVQPVPCLPADPRRKSLMIRCVSTQVEPAPLDLANWSDEPTKVTAPTAGSIPALASQVYDRDGWVTLIGHTGPLWVTGVGTANPVRFMWCAVTL